MKDSLEIIRRKMERADELSAVVRTMKAMAASSISQYEKSVQALSSYYQTVELALAATYQRKYRPLEQPQKNAGQTNRCGIIIFGSDLGLVGQFNQVLFEYAQPALSAPDREIRLWSVGERMYAVLEREGMKPAGSSPVPLSVSGITGLTASLLQVIEEWLSADQISSVRLFYNHPVSGASFEPGSFGLIPPDQPWQEGLLRLKWPGPSIPEILEQVENALGELLQEYFFVSVYKACAESLASENASRLAAMQRAEKNIREMKEDLHLAYQQLRQQSIDEELFDVVYGSEALADEEKKKHGSSGSFH